MSTFIHAVSDGSGDAAVARLFPLVSLVGHRAAIFTWFMRGIRMVPVSERPVRQSAPIL